MSETSYKRPDHKSRWRSLMVIAYLREKSDSDYPGSLTEYLLELLYAMFDEYTKDVLDFNAMEELIAMGEDRQDNDNDASFGRGSD